MVDARALSALLEALYATPFEPDRWVNFLDLICDITGSRGAYLIGADRDRSLSISVQGGLKVEPEVLARYAQDIAPDDIYRRAIIRQQRIGFVVCEELLTQEEYLQSGLYLMQNSNYGLVYSGTLVLNCSLQRMDVIAIWRTAEQGRMPEVHRELFELLEPHVRAVVEIRRKLGVLKQHASGLEAMLNSSRTPTFLLDGSGKLLNANDAARALLEENDGLLVAQDELRTRDSATQTRLRKSVHELSKVPDGVDRKRSIPFPIPRRNKEPLQALLATAENPLRNSSVSSARNILLVSDPTKAAPLPKGSATEYFGLTSAEEEVADGLLTGYTLEEISFFRKTTIGTVRQQVKSIFAKTGTTRQADLVRVLAAMPRLSQH